MASISGCKQETSNDETHKSETTISYESESEISDGYILSTSYGDFTQENDKLRAQMECDILNNCPLCGGEAEIQLVIDNYYIECNNCGLHTDYFKSKDELIKYWNK